MSCSTIAALAGAMVMYSYNYDNDPRKSDEYVIAPHEEAYAQICYYNNEAQTSLRGLTTLEYRDLTAVVETDIGNSMHEQEGITISVSPGFIVDPDTTVWVKDGDTHTALIYWAAF